MQFVVTTEGFAQLRPSFVESLILLRELIPINIDLTHQLIHTTQRLRCVITPRLWTRTPIAYFFHGRFRAFFGLSPALRSNSTMTTPSILLSTVRYGRMRIEYHRP